MSLPTSTTVHSGKKVLLIMGLLAAVLLSTMLLAQYLMEHHTPAAIDWSERGSSFGDGRREEACMHEVEPNFSACPDRQCRAQWGIFFARCIERAQPLEGRCVGVPDLKDKLETNQWRLNYCARFQLASNACLELAGWAHKFCLQ